MYLEKGESISKNSQQHQRIISYKNTTTKITETQKMYVKYATVRLRAFWVSPFERELSKVPWV